MPFALTLHPRAKFVLCWLFFSIWFFQFYILWKKTPKNLWKVSLLASKIAWIFEENTSCLLELDWITLCNLAAYRLQMHWNNHIGMCTVRSNECATKGFLFGFKSTRLWMCVPIVRCVCWCVRVYVSRFIVRNYRSLCCYRQRMTTYSLVNP